MQAGRFRHRISIQRPVVNAQDSAGAPILDEWEEVGKVWAEIIYSSAKEFGAAYATQSEIVGRLVTRVQDYTIDATMRGVHGQKIYNIAGVLPDPKYGNEYITMPFSEGVRNDAAG